MGRRRGYKRYSAEFKREALKRASRIQIVFNDISQRLFDSDAGAGCTICYLVRHATKKQAL